MAPPQWSRGSRPDCQPDTAAGPVDCAEREREGEGEEGEGDKPPSV